MKEDHTVPSEKPYNPCVAGCNLGGMLALGTFEVRFSTTIPLHSFQRMILACPSNQCHQVHAEFRILSLNPINEAFSENYLRSDVEWELLSACISLLARFLSIVPERAT
jgi:hypothetical protein